jgi:hypothetical protein
MSASLVPGSEASSNCCWMRWRSPTLSEICSSFQVGSNKVQGETAGQTWRQQDAIQRGAATW